MRYILSNRGRASFRRCRRFRFLLQRILLHVFVYGRRNRTCRRSRAAMMHILSGRPAAIYRGCQSARAWRDAVERDEPDRSEEHTSELQSLMRISYAVFCLKKKKRKKMYTGL